MTDHGPANDPRGNGDHAAKRHHDTATIGGLAQASLGGPRPPQAGLWARLRAYLIAGILVTAPLGLTAYLTFLFITFVDDRVSQLLPSQYVPEHTLPGVGVLIALAFFVVAGWFARNFLGRFLIALAEYFVRRVPVVSQLYAGIKQITETALSAQSRPFREAVLVEYPRRDCWTLGFITAETSGEIRASMNEEMVNVFIPTTPNPTSGYLLFVPRRDIYPLSIATEDAIKLVVSAGMVMPGDNTAAPASPPAGPAGDDPGRQP